MSTTTSSSVNERRLFLSGEVTSSSVKPLIEAITKFNLEDDKKANEVVGYDRAKNPIYIMIDSIGGSVYAGLSLINAIEISSTPIHTINIGLAASMALFIFVSGETRYTTRFSTFMYHDISYGAGGTHEEVSRRVKINEKLKEKGNDYLLERTLMRRDELKKYDDRIEDWYFDSEEAIKLGVANAKILGKTRGF